MLNRRQLLRAASAGAVLPVLAAAEDETEPTAETAPEQPAAEGAQGQAVYETIAENAETSRIHVRAVEPVVVRGQNSTWLLVRLRTDAGLEGLGECFAPSDAMIQPVLGHLRMIGRRIANTDAVNVAAFLRGFKRLDAGGAWAAAVAGIEIAMWDVLGQAAGLPIYRLLGGAAQPRVPLYVSYGSQRAENLLDLVREKQAQGFGMVKFDPFTSIPFPRVHSDVKELPEPTALMEAIERVKTWREALGRDFRIAVDGHWKFSVEGAIAAARALEPFGPVFFEEPVSWPNDPQALRQVAAATRIPLATGEHLLHVQEAAPVLSRGIVRYVQPEVTSNHGLLETYKMATIAEAYGAWVAPHGYVSPVSALAASHVSAAIPNLFFQEWPGRVPDAPWEQELLEPPIRIENGHLIPSASPGLGARLNDDFVRAHRADG